MPVFGLVYYVLSAIFVMVFFISLVYNLYKKPEKGQRLLVRDDDDDLEPIFKQ